MSSVYTAAPEPAPDGSNQVEVARAVKQTTEALIREVENLQTQISNLQSAVGVAAPGDQATILVGGGNGGMSLPGNDAALDAIFTRAVEQSQIYVRQARTEAQSALSALRVALDNFESGYADTNAVVNATIDSLVSRVGDNEASIFNEQLTRTTATQALAGRIATINSVMNGNSAAITTEQVTRANADSALAAQIVTIEATTGANTAAITAETIARTDADSALAVDINTVEATTGANTAAIEAETVARTNADSALATQITTVEAIADAGTAGGFYRLIALSSPTDGASAEFAVEVKASSGGAYSSAGMSIQAFSTGENRIKMRTDRFIVADSTNSYSPFQIITGLNQTTFATTDVTAAVWTGSQFVVGGTNGAIGTSPNGDEWTYQSALAATTWGTKTVLALAASPTTIVAVGTLGGAAYSTDGIAWTYPTAATRLSGTTFGTNNANAIVWTGSVFVVGGGDGRVATSPDGIVWTYQGGLRTLWGGVTIRSLVWNGTTLLVTGDNGYAATATVSGSTWTWTNQTTNFRASGWGSTVETRAAVWFNSRFVVVGDNGQAATGAYNSTTLAWEWTYQPGLAATAWLTTAAAVLVVQGAQLLVGGTTGYIATSFDGITWTYQPALRASAWGTSNNVLAAASNGTMTLVAGNIGATAYSQNATLWTNNAGRLGANVVVSAASVIGAQLEELGLMSYYNQITAQNAVTLIGTAAIGTAFIADAAITSAKIGFAEIKEANIEDATITSAKIGFAEIKEANIEDLAVTTAKIQDLSVETLKIAGNAVTFPRGIYTAGTIIVETGTVIQSLTMTPTGAPVSVTASFVTANIITFSSEIGSPPYRWKTQIRRLNGGVYTYLLENATVAAYQAFAESSTQPGREVMNGFGLASATIIDAAPPSGVSCTYEVIIYVEAGGVVTSSEIAVSNRALQLLELKR